MIACSFELGWEVEFEGEEEIERLREKGRDGEMENKAGVAG